MPLIDNYLLDNYAIDGIDGSKYRSSQLANGNPSFNVPGNTSSSPAIAYDTGTRFPAGTKLITLAAVNNSARFVLSPSVNVYAQWALLDAAGVIWPLTLGTPSQTYSYNSIIVDLEAGLASSGYTSNNFGFTTSQAQWNYLSASVPSAFNKESELKLVVAGANSNASSQVVTAIITAVKFISA